MIFSALTTCLKIARWSYGSPDPLYFFTHFWKLDGRVFCGYYVVPFPVGNPIKEVNLLDPEDPPGPVGPNPPKWPLLANVSNLLLLFFVSFFESFGGFL